MPCKKKFKHYIKLNSLKWDTHAVDVQRVLFNMTVGPFIFWNCAFSWKSGHSDKGSFYLGQKKVAVKPAYVKQLRIIARAAIVKMQEEERDAAAERSE